MFQSSAKFCQTYEREFRVFAADENEKRLRFKPMQPNQRAFIHSLAEDFGFDSESQDPEPHRHVCIFKTPRFVSAPMKTLAQCVKLKPAAVPEPAQSSSKPFTSSAEPFNAFLLSNPKFGLTIDELHADLVPEFTAANIEFEISFLASGEIVLKALSTGSWHQKIESTLSSMKGAVSKKTKSLDLASSISLCTVDGNLNVIRREDDHAGGGWSQVAKGGPGGRVPVKESVGAKSSFTVLGSKSVLRKKVLQEEAVDDWEREVEGWDAG